MMKVLAIIALLCPFALTANVVTDACPEDEVSLIQKNTVVTQRPGKNTETAQLLSTDEIEKVVDAAEAKAFDEAEAEVNKKAKMTQPVINTDMDDPDEDVVYDAHAAGVAEPNPDEHRVAEGAAEDDTLQAYDGSLLPDETAVYNNAITNIDETERVATTDDKAVIDSTPGIAGGKVTTAWHTNLDKAKAKIEEAQADRIEFINKVQSERRDNEEDTRSALSADTKAVADALESDDRAVREAFDRRLEVQRNAIHKMEEARQAWESRSIKKDQALEAAAVGRWTGNSEGAENAALAADQYTDGVARRTATRQRVDAKVAALRQREWTRAAIDHDTINIVNAERELVADHDASARAIEAGRAARAAEEEALINGADDSRNVYLSHAANRYANELDREAARDQQRIDTAAAGHLPSGLGSQYVDRAWEIANAGAV